MTRLLARLTCFSLISFSAVPAWTAECDLDRPVIFAGMDWQSNAFHTAVARIIIEHGLGCETDELPGTGIPLLQGVAQGDVDVVMEAWKDNVTAVWDRALRRRQVVELGTNFPGATQGWYVPRYLVEGDDAPAEGLKSVTDLPRYKELFSDPEEPDKGRFYNCIAGWTCEAINSAKLKAYDLDQHYTNFRPGTGAALDAAIASAYTRGEPILAYYWSPTWLLGKYDMVMLEEPAYDADVFEALAKDPEPEGATAYPVIEVVVGANRRFAEAAPNLVKFLSAYETNVDLINAALAYMQDTGSDAEAAAVHFLTTQPDVWHGWLEPDQAKAVDLYVQAVSAVQ